MTKWLLGRGKEGREKGREEKKVGRKRRKGRKKGPERGEGRKQANLDLDHFFAPKISVSAVSLKNCYTREHTSIISNKEARKAVNFQKRLLFSTCAHVFQNDSAPMNERALPGSFPVETENL